MHAALRTSGFSIFTKVAAKSPNLTYRIYSHSSASLVLIARNLLATVETGTDSRCTRLLFPRHYRRRTP